MFSKQESSVHLNKHVDELFKSYWIKNQGVSMQVADCCLCM